MKKILVCLSIFSLVTVAIANDAQKSVSKLINISAKALADSVRVKSGVETVLGISRGDQVFLPFEHESRAEWSYWPRVREGLPLDYMTTEQKQLLHNLLLTALSGSGYQKVINIMQLENVLAPAEVNGLPRGVGTYEIVIFGEPGETTPWGWRFEGHHVSLNITINGDQISVTPSFLGSNPGEIRTGPLAGFRPLHMEEDLGFDLLWSLDSHQRNKAILSDQAPFDVMSGTIMKDRGDWDHWKTTLLPDGIPVAELDSYQQGLVHKIVNEIIGTYRPEIAETYLQDLEITDLHFAWLGSQARGKPYYYRIVGKDFVFEFDNAQNDGNHIHSVWHDRSGNFGDDILVKHYIDDHQRN